MGYRENLTHLEIRSVARNAKWSYLKELWICWGKNDSGVSAIFSLHAERHCVLTVVGKDPERYEEEAMRELRIKTCQVQD